MKTLQEALSGNKNAIAILVASLLLRWLLIFQGGQYYFPDEVRYLNAREIATAILGGNFQKALADLTVSPEHIGFRLIGILPAIPEVVFDLGPAAPALFFSLFSVLSLYLIWRLAHRTGMSPVAADYALLIAAGSLSLMYYTRHLLPYDLALSIGLFALYLGLRPGANAGNSLATGAASFLSFISYNGYWPLAGFAFLAHALHGSESNSHRARKALFFVLGVMLPFAALILIGSIGSHSNMIAGYLGFAGSVTQGDHAEGWKLPFEYLWHAEHALLLIAAGLGCYALYKPAAADRRAVNLWFGGALFVYLCLSIPSTTLQVFVVYGRTVRQLVPFLALLAGVGLAKLQQARPFGKQISSAILILAFLQAGWNIVLAYSVAYPIEFIKAAEAQYPGFAMSQKRTNTGAPPICQHREYLAVHVKYIHPEPEPIPVMPGDLVLSNPHPLNFLPYQYEGYTPEQRQTLREENIAMELYKIPPGDRFHISGTPVPDCVAANP